MGIFSWLLGGKPPSPAERADRLATLYESFGPRDRAQAYSTYLLGLAYVLKELRDYQDARMHSALIFILKGEFIPDHLVPHVKKKIQKYIDASHQLKDTGDQFNRILANGLNLISLFFEGGYEISVTPQMTRVFNAISVHDKDTFSAMYNELHFLVDRLSFNEELSIAYSSGVPLLYTPH